MGHRRLTKRPITPNLSLYPRPLQHQNQINTRASKSFQKVFEGWDFAFDDSEGAENHRAFFKLFAEDIVRERKRIGGDWAVASAHVLNKDWRQFVRYGLLTLQLHYQTI